MMKEAIKMLCFLFAVLFFSFANISSAETRYAPPISKEKSNSAFTKATLANIRAQAELYFDYNQNSYKDLCKKDLKNLSVKSALDSLKDEKIKKVNCIDSKGYYAVEAFLEYEKEYFCVDSTGYADMSKKSKGKNSLFCKGPAYNYGDQTELLFKNFKGVKDNYKIGDKIQFSFELWYKDKKGFIVNDGSLEMRSYIERYDKLQNLSLVTGFDSQEDSYEYDKKKKIWKFSERIPGRFADYPGIGKYTLGLIASCSKEETECSNKLNSLSHAARIEINIK